MLKAAVNKQRRTHKQWWIVRLPNSLERASNMAGTKGNAKDRCDVYKAVWHEKVCDRENYETNVQSDCTAVSAVF